MDNFLRAGLLLAVLGLAVSTVWLASNELDEGAGIVAALCFGLCIFVFLYRFKRFKGLGFEGELWEQEMEKAAELRRGLQDLSERVGESIYWDLGEGFRLGPSDPDKILGIIERTDRNLESVGISRLKIEEMKRPWHKCIVHDLADPIAKRLRDLLVAKQRGIQAELDAFGGAVPAARREEYDALTERQGEIAKVLAGIQSLIWREDYENVPNLLRQTIEELQLLADQERHAIYTDCADAFRDIDQYARERTIRRTGVLKL